MATGTWSTEKEVLAAHAAYLHFIADENHTQQDIARELDVDPATVSRLLRYARESGLLHVSLNLPRISDLELQLTRRFRLHEAIVVPLPWPKPKTGESLFRRLLCEAAAHYLEGPATPLKDGQTIAISCGKTVRDLIIATHSDRFSKMHLVQLCMEAVWQNVIDSSPFTLVGMLHGKWGHGDEHAKAVQPLPGSMCKSGVYTPEYKRCREIIIPEAAKADVVLLGIGSLKGTGSVFPKILKANGVDASKLRGLGAVGTIANRPFDAQGRDLFDEVPGLKECIDGVSLEELRSLASSTGTVIGIAGGKRKIQPIRIALKARYLNYLITDMETAEQLLK